MSDAEIPSGHVPFEIVTRESLETAAGGNCSLSVLQLMHGIDAVLQRQPPHITATVYSRQQLAEQEVKISKIVSIDNQLYIGATSGVHDDKVVQDIFIVKKSLSTECHQAIKLWTLREEPQDAVGNCSVAIFWPAFEKGDWNFSTVVSRLDDSNPVTSDNLVKDEWLTNKKIVDSLVNAFRYGRLDKSLIEDLQLHQLLEAYLPADALPVHPGIFQEAVIVNEVSKILSDRLQFLGAVGISGTTNSKFNSRQDVDKQHSIELSPRPEDDRYALALIFSGLGTKKRRVEFGSLRIPEISEPPVAYDNSIEVPKVIADIPVDLEKLFAIPQIIPASPELKRQLESVFHDYINQDTSTRNATFIDKRVGYHVGQFLGDLDLGVDVLVNIGSIDITALGAGQFFESNLWNRIVCHVTATSQQDVFCSVKGGHNLNLYGCSVDGANKAFVEVSGSRLVAKNCQQAFVNDRGSKGQQWESTLSNYSDCAAINCAVAFTHARKAMGCIAENCSQAFIHCEEVIYSIARFCGIAFHYNPNSHNTKKGAYKTEYNTAEFCDNAFTEATGHEMDSVCNNSVINPPKRTGKYFQKVDPYNFTRALGSVNLFKRRHNRIVNPLQGPGLARKARAALGVPKPKKVKHIVR